MEKYTTSDRLKWLMSERGLRQVDILERCKPYCAQYNVKLGRNDLSQYVSGKVQPSQRKLTILGLALGVSEAWLMGYDVSMSRTDYSVGVNNGIIGNENHHNTITVGEPPITPKTPIVSAIITICNSLSESDQAKVLAFVTDLLSSKKESK